MSYYGVQVTLIFILTLINTEAKKPPGYVAPPKEYDPNPPKYEYGYRIQEEKATHGKDEQRDGVYAQGRYYVEKGTESSHSVKYFADDWGYHPVVEYSNRGPYSKSSTNFVLGEEAIKLKNNQKSIPQDPSDPGKAENLAKFDPSGQNRLPPQQYFVQGNPSIQQPTDNQPEFQGQQPQQVVIENQSEKPTVILTQQDQPQIIVQQDPSYSQPLLSVEQPVSHIQSIPTPNTQHEVPTEPTGDNNPPQLIKIEDPQTVILQSTPQPDVLLQKQPEELPVIRLENDQSAELNNDPGLVDPKPQHQEDLIEQPVETRTPQQPIFYYVQPQQGQFDVNMAPSAAGNQLVDQVLRPQINIQLTGPENQLFYPAQNYQPLVHITSPANQNVILQNNENIPRPQALIYPQKEQNDLVEQLQSIPTGPSSENQQILINNDIVDVKEHSGQILETAALTKIPNKIVEFSNRHREFGAKLSPKAVSKSITKNLIESTKNLVSGADVLNINAAVSQSHAIETSTLQSLLNQYISPTIVNNHVNVDVNHFEVVSSTTVVPPVTVETSLLREPIIVAESPEDSENKPVIEKTEENKEYFSSTSRSSLISSTTAVPEDIENSSEQILVTPRPVSSKFLAPITAGVQLQHIEEPIFEDTKTVETHEGYQTNKKVVVQVQKTIPYYLGMYEYPSGYAAQYRGHKMSGREKAIENIELGKTLLYFPGEESKSERVSHELPKAELSQGIPEVNSNYLTVQQLPSKHIKQNFVENDQQALQGQQQLFIETEQSGPQALEQVVDTESKVEQQFYSQGNRATEITKLVHQPYPVPYPVVQKVPYPVEKIVDRPVQVPVQVTRYVDRPYPIKVPVPFPQPYPVEKVIKEPYAVPVRVEVPFPVERIVKEPYPVPVHVHVPVEKIVERGIPVPYYGDRGVGNQVPHHINRHYPVQNQAYLLQIPGLFTQQKYSALIHNSYSPQKLQIQYSVNRNHKTQDQYAVQNLGPQGVNPYSYASHINQYLPPKKEVHLNRGQKLKKLNLLVFPRVNVPVSLPPVTKNPYDLQHSQSYQSFRHSNAQLDNGYLPPVASPQPDGEHGDHQASASISNSYNINHLGEPLGLVPPKLQNFDQTRKYRTARSHFDDTSIRMEYGFMPPLIPSLEIDEQGRPIEKDDNKN